MASVLVQKLRLLVLLLFLIINSKLLEKKEPQVVQPNYEKIIDRIKHAVLDQNSKFHHASYNRLAQFVDTFGPRLFGSTVLELSIEDFYKQAKAQNLDNVRKEPFTGFVRWIRGKESLTLFSPRPFPSKLRLIGLGMSVGGNVTAEVVVVTSYDQLSKLGNEKIQGKIVCFANQWQGYVKTVVFRQSGPIKVASYGGVGVLIRSVTPQSIDSPHTGTTNYDPNVPQIPAAAITVQDAEMFLRMYRRGQKIIVNLYMESTFEENASSSNLIAEVKGEVYPEQVVLLGGHIDSWDNGSQTGANDDGGGIMVTFEVVRLIKQLGLRPQRTIRFIAWSGEEMIGTQNGAYWYAKMHQDELQNHIAAFQSDLGSTWINGFGFTGSQNGFQYIEDLRVQYLTKVNITLIKEGQGFGLDILPLYPAHVPMLNNRIQDNENHDFYFTYHHSGGDSMSIMNPDEMDSNVIGIASLIYLLADLEEPLPRD